MSNKIKAALKAEKINEEAQKYLSPQLTNRIIWLPILIICSIILARGFVDSDLYYMLAAGRGVLENGITHTNPLIIAENYGYVMQNWLYCVFLAKIEAVSGSIGLWISFLVQIFTMLVLTLKFFNYKELNFSQKIYACAGIVSGLLVFDYLNIRAEVITYIFILLEILVLEKYSKDKRPAILATLPLIMLAEINLHASYWIMHFVIMIPYFCPVFALLKTIIKNGYINDSRIKIDKWILVSAAAMIGAIFLNPYGIDNITYVFKALFSEAMKDNIIGIGEQYPASVAQKEAVMLLISMIIFIEGIRKKWFNITSVLMFLGFWILATTKIKWFPFFVLGYFYIIRDISTKAPAVDAKIETRIKEAFSKPYQVVVAIYCFGVIAFCLFSSVKEIGPGIDYLRTADTYKGLDAVADYLNDADKDASIVSQLHINNYFEWAGFKVYYDARPELYFDKENEDEEYSILEKMQIVYKGKNMEDKVISYDQYEKTLLSVNADYLLVTEASLYPYHYFESQGIEPVYMDNSYRLYNLNELRKAKNYEL